MMASSQWKFSLQRLCIVCKTAHPYPLAEPERWTRVDLGGQAYWQCPLCTQEAEDA